MSEEGEASTSRRFERALVAFVKQEFNAPLAAITGFTEILLEDSRQQGLDAFVADLERIAGAAREIWRLFQVLLEADAQPAPSEGGGFAAFRAQLRHDLRNPLNAVKGYGEMLIEEAREEGHEFLIHDLTKVLEAAGQLLERLDALVESGRGAGEADAARRAATSRDAVSGVLDSIRPISADGTDGGRALSSRILVVDDTPANRDLLARRLIREGHFVETAESGAAALELLAASGFDLVLLDLIMPAMSGFDVLRRIKANPATRDIPVIMVSALDEIDSTVRCIEAGAEDYLPKPFNPVLLRARINASLEKKRLRDREQAFTEQLRAEKEKSEALLLNILPRTIVQRMRQGEIEIADRFADVTILFSDLVGFTSLAARFPPSRVIELLNRVFTEFDRLADEHGLEKIKTIGDAYMVAGGLPEARPGHALAAADMALRMIEVVREAGEVLGETLHVRIGIHTGPATAGIIGRHKFIYDVWGDTVNTASRMESHGLPNRIHLSSATFHAIRDSFECAPRGALEIRGKGMMETYLLLHRRASA